MEFHTENTSEGKVYFLRQSQDSHYLAAGVLGVMAVLMFIFGNTREWYGYALPLIPLGIGVYMWLTAEGYASEIRMDEKRVIIERQVGKHTELRSIPFDEIAAVQCAKVWFINNQAARLPSITARIRLKNSEELTMAYAYGHPEVLVATTTIARGVGVPLEQMTEERRI